MYIYNNIYVCICVCVCVYQLLLLLENRQTNMSLHRIWFVLLLALFLSGDGLMAEWCIANEQIPEGELQVGLDWACGVGGANCSKIQVGQACFQPNTLRAHASYAFNNYYQKFKHRGANCHFNGAAITSYLDPSHESCHYELTP